MKRANIVFLCDASALVVNQVIGNYFSSAVIKNSDNSDFWSNIKDWAEKADKKFHKSNCKIITDNEDLLKLNSLDSSPLSDLYSFKIETTVFLRQIEVGKWVLVNSIADAA